MLKMLNLKRKEYIAHDGERFSLLVDDHENKPRIAGFVVYGASVKSV